jgi:carbamate kinase
MLASLLGAGTLILSTSVEQVALDYGRPTQRPIVEMSLDEAERHLAEGQFPAGSMGPKIQAAIEFLRAQDGQVIVTSLERTRDALAGRAGTRIVRRSAVATGAPAWKA